MIFHSEPNKTRPNQPISAAKNAMDALPNGARTILAPLCGITTAPFRRICLDQGADMAVTEMISSDAMTRGKSSHCRAISGLDMNEGPLSLQIFGADPERMAETAAILSDAHQPEYLDMNFGCPVKKIVSRNGGSGVLRDVKLLYNICKRVVERSSVPVSAKIRAGWDKSAGDGVRDIARTIEDAGIAMIAVHARTKKQAFQGRANWELIAQAKSAVGIPVIGNGDVRSADDVLRMGEETGCDAVMIGRGAIGNPWVFAEVRAKLDGADYAPPTPGERVATLLDHAREAARLDGEPRGIVSLRKVMGAYIKHLPGARALRERLMQTDYVAELEELLGRYLEELETPV
jgi:tRNA-dihydrouridine synthase B